MIDQPSYGHIRWRDTSLFSSLMQVCHCVEKGMIPVLSRIPKYTNLWIFVSLWCLCDMGSQTENRCIIHLQCTLPSRWSKAISSLLLTIACAMDIHFGIIRSKQTTSQDRVRMESDAVSTQARKQFAFCISKKSIVHSLVHCRLHPSSFVHDFVHSADLPRWKVW